MSADLIDLRSQSGLSGSPVFTEGVKGALSLLGVLVGHYDETQRIIVSDDESFVSAQNTGVSFVAPARRLLELINQADLRELRDENEFMHEADNNFMDPMRFPPGVAWREHEISLAEMIEGPDLCTTCGRRLTICSVPLGSCPGWNTSKTQ